MSIASLTVRQGKIEDVVNALPLIRAMIPEKADLTENNLRSRLSGKRHGIKVVEYAREIVGVNVWYEDGPDLYLWLGANVFQGFGIMSCILSQLEKETQYKRWHTKTSLDKPAALHVLKKQGFMEYRHEGNMVHLEKYLPSTGPAKVSGGGE